MNTHTWFFRVALILIIPLSGCETLRLDRTGAFIGSMVQTVTGRKSDAGDITMQGQDIHLQGSSNQSTQNQGTLILASQSGTNHFIRSAFSAPLDQKDRERLAAVLETGRSGTVREWANFQTGEHFSVIPFEKELDEAGKICRDFVLKSGERGESPVATNSMACRVGAGNWELSTGRTGKVQSVSG